MVTKRTYYCNVCRDEVDGLGGVGFSFRSGDTEFEEGNVGNHENHLCYKCIAAIYDLSVRISHKRMGE